jgi:hypothetical protein
MLGSLFYVNSDRFRYAHTVFVLRKHKISFCIFRIFCFLDTIGLPSLSLSFHSTENLFIQFLPATVTSTDNENVAPSRIDLQWSSSLCNTASMFRAFELEIFKLNRSRDSSVGIAVGCGLDGRKSTPGRSRRSFSPPQCPDPF